MYKLTEELPIQNQKEFAEKIGISQEYLSKIQNKRLDCGKTTAYAITKAFDKDLKILDLFERVEE